MHSARKTSGGGGSGLGRGTAGPAASVGRMQIPRPQCSWSHRVSQSDSSVTRSEPFLRGAGMVEPLGAWEPAASAPHNPLFSTNRIMCFSHK